MTCNSGGKAVLWYFDHRASKARVTAFLPERTARSESCSWGVSSSGCVLFWLQQPCRGVEKHLWPELRRLNVLVESRNYWSVIIQTLRKKM